MPGSWLDIGAFPLLGCFALKIPHLSELRQDYDRSSVRVHVIVRIFLLCGLAALIWALIGFFALPPVLRSQMGKRLSAQLQRPVSVERVRVNPLVLSLTVEGFKIADKDVETWVGWQRLYVNFDTFSVFLREWRFQDIELDGFVGRVQIDKEGRLNFADVIDILGAPRPKVEQRQASSWPLFIARLAVADARLYYDDASQGEPFHSEVGPTTVILRDFHTGGKGHAPGEFTATTESGEVVSWRGNLSFVPLRSAGDFEIAKIALKKYSPYYAKRVAFDVLDGRLTLAGHYEFSLEEGKPLFRLTEGRSLLQTLRIAPRGKTDPVVDIDQIEVADTTAAWPAMNVEVGRVVVSGGSVSARRTAEGLDLVKVLAPVSASVPAATSPAAAQAASSPMNIKLGAVSMRKLALTVEDLTTPRPALHQFSDLNCDLRNLTSAAPFVPVPVGFRSNYAKDGQVHLAGTVTLSPLKAQLGVELTNVSLAGLSPYAEAFAKVRVGRGRMTTALYLGAEMEPGKTPAVSVQGEFNVDQFAIYDANEADEILSWRSLSVKGLEYVSEPGKLLATEVSWIEPSGHLIVNKDGNTNIDEAMGRGAGIEPQPTATVKLPGPDAVPASPLEGMAVSLDRFVLEKAAVDFTDRSLLPNVRIGLNQLSGQIEGLSSSELARATVDLRGRVDGVTPITITGKTNPLSADAFTDLKVMMKGMELAPVGPYLGKFAGYELERGTLNFDIKCLIKRRKVDSANVATIDQFTFGAPTNSPDATQLPVRLAVALLRDTSGRIVLDIPVQGSLDDPNFRVGRVVWRVITNLLTKAATSPFTLLGSMFGGGRGEELSYQAFLPGEDIPVNDEEIKKLDIVAKALKERPSLHLEILGGYDEALDATVLREQMLDAQMRNIIWNDRRLIEPEITLEQIEVDPAQRNGMIRRLYYKAFPKEKPKRSSPGDPGYADDSVAGQRGNLGAFQRKKRDEIMTMPRPAVVPKPKKKENDGTTETAPELKEIKPPSFEEMKARLLEQLTVDEESFRKLASMRANAVRLYLINYGEVPPERISLAAITQENPAAKGARVELKLK